MKKVILYLTLALILVGTATAAAGNNGMVYFDFEDSTEPVADLYYNTTSDGNNSMTSPLGTYQRVADAPTFNVTGDGGSNSLDMNNPGGDANGMQFTSNAAGWSNWTFTFWTKMGSDLGANVKWILTPSANMWIRKENDDTIQWKVDLDTTFASSSSIYADSNWHMWTFTVDSAGNCIIYYDAASDASTSGCDLTTTGADLHFGAAYDNSGGIDNYFDEVRVYNRTLPVSEINNLYNCGEISCAVPPPAAGIVAYYTATFNETAVLTHRLNITDANINDSSANSAFMIWNNTRYNATIENRTQGFIGFNLTIPAPLIDANKSVVFFNWTFNISYNDIFIWNETDLYNQTGLYAYGVTNFTILTNISEFSTIPIAFNVNKLNLTMPITSYEFIFNNSIVITNTTSGNYGVNNSYTIPPISEDLSSALVNASANFTIDYLGKSVTRSSPQRVINISSLSMTNCSVADIPELSFYLYQEGNLANTTGNLDATFINWIDSIATNRTFSYGLAGQIAYHFCFNLAGGSFYTDSTQVYYSANHATRNYFLLNQSFTAGQQNNISLYLLNATDSTNIIVTVTDNLDDPLTNHYVEVLRYYPDENVFRTVEISRTDVNGEALLHLVALTGEEPFYQFIIKDQYGKVLKVTNPSKIVTSTINIQVLFQDEFIELLDEIDAISHTLTYNNNTGVATYFFSDSNNIVTKGIVEAKKITPLGATVLCHNEVESVSGTIYCDTGNATGNIIIQGTVILTNGDTELLTEAEIHTFENTMGDFGLLLFIIELSMVSAAGLFHPAAGVLFGLMITLANVVIGILPFGWVTMAMFTILAGLIIVRLRT